MPAYHDKTRDTWFCKFYYRDYDGERRQKWKRGFATREDALSYEKNFLDMNLTSAGEERFKSVYEEYIQDVKNTLKPSTIVTKESIFKNWILPYFGSKKLENITVADVRRWQVMIMNDEKHYTKRYIMSINTQLSSFMNYANRIYGLPSNPCKRAGAVSGAESKEREFWTPEEYELFRDAVSEDICAFTCFEVLYWTGMREGELLGLFEDDIDFDKRQIHIRRTYLRMKGEDYFQTPKTKASTRVVDIPRFLCDEIKVWLRQLSRSKRKYRIFPVQRQFLERRMRKYSLIAGVKRIRIHSLRASAVSLLINLGFQPIEISRRVGHEKVSTTLDIYGKLFPSSNEAIIKGLEKMDRMFKNNKKKRDLE